MNSQQSLVLSVPQHVARNPVARSIERANLKRWYTATALEASMQADGSPADSLIRGIAEAIAIAIKATDGFNDPSDIKGALLAAMMHLVHMTEAGSKWDAKHAGELCDALDYAVQILSGSDPSDKMKAWAWMVKTARGEVAV